MNKWNIYANVKKKHCQKRAKATLTLRAVAIQNQRISLKEEKKFGRGNRIFLLWAKHRVVETFVWRVAKTFVLWFPLRWSIHFLRLFIFPLVYPEMLEINWVRMAKEGIIFLFFLQKKANQLLYFNLLKMRIFQHYIFYKYSNLIFQVF